MIDRTLNQTLIKNCPDSFGKNKSQNSIFFHKDKIKLYLLLKIIITRYGLNCDAS